jgi:hypothetical protein
MPVPSGSGSSNGGQITMTVIPIYGPSGQTSSSGSAQSTKLPGGAKAVVGGVTQKVSQVGASTNKTTVGPKVGSKGKIKIPGADPTSGTTPTTSQTGSGTATNNTTNNTTNINNNGMSPWASFGWGYFAGLAQGFAGAGSSAPVGSAVAYDAIPATDVTPATPVTADPAQPADGELTMTLGQSYTINNHGYGAQAGDLSLQVNDLTLAVRVDQWDARQISFTLPSAGLRKVVDGTFQISGADHKLLKAVPVRVAAAEVSQ